MIRAIPTNSADRLYCKVLGQGAVHGAFAGYTDFTVGLVRTGRERERGEERARGDD
jgi:6-phosphofructokinase 1